MSLEDLLTWMTQKAQKVKDSLPSPLPPDLLTHPQDFRERMSTMTQKTEPIRAKARTLDSFLHQNLLPLLDKNKQFVESTLEDAFGKSSWWQELKRKIQNL